MADQDWDNEDKLPMRTKLALKVLMLMFKILSPYRFEHRFTDALKSLEKEIGEL